jgi:signal transduction histidine kinase
MRLALRFAAAVAVAAVAVMVGHNLLADREEQTMFEEEHEQDLQVMEALEATLEAVAASQGAEGVRQVAIEANRRARDARFRFVVLHDPDVVHPNEVPPEADAAVRRDETVSLTRQDASGVPRRLTYLPVKLDGQVRGALELSQSTAAHDKFSWRRRVIVLLTTITLLALSTFVVLAIGVYAVARPLERVRSQARAVGEGEIGIRLGLQRRDEIGQLAREMDAMCERIVAERLRLAAHTEERIASLEQLRHTDRLTTMGQLASGVAHELGTPLNVVAQRAKMIESSSAEATSKTNARIVQEQVARMIVIIRQLLDFSRRQSPRLGVVSVRDFVTKTLDLLGPLIAKNAVQASLEVPDEALLVHADRNQLQQVLTNVVMNSVQAMPHGGRLGVRVRAAKARPPGDPAAPGEEYIAVSVEDEGVGIPRDHLSRIFEPFFTTKGIGEGTGLGLSVAYGIVQEHGGWIDVESEVGRGSRFTIWLRRSVESDERAIDTAS